MLPRFLTLAALSALLLALTIPPVGAHYFLWVAWIPLLSALERASSRSDALRAGAVFGLIYYGLIFRWAVRLPVFAGLLILAGGALYAAYFAWGMHWARRLPAWARAAAAPVAWVAPALIADNPWHPFWNTVVLMLGMHAPLPAAFLQLAHPFGEPGLAFFAVLVNALLWRAVEARARRREAAMFAGAAAALLIGGWAWGAAQARRYSAGDLPRETVRVACAQHDLPFDWAWRAAHQDEIYATYERLALEARRRGAGVVLFPQYQIPEDIYRNPERWGKIARKAGVTMALGTYAPVQPGIYGKEAWVISLVFSPDGKMCGTHRALHPSPFGRPMVVAGEDANAIPVPSLGRLAILPCFDDVTPRPTRLFSHGGADFIAAIANDGPFKGTVHPDLHVIRSRLRAVESRRYLVHCTPNGISAVIDPAGRVLDSLPAGRGLLVHDFPSAGDGK